MQSTNDMDVGQQLLQCFANICNSSVGAALASEEQQQHVVAAAALLRAVTTG